jgi:general secretion pathway protein C
MSKTYHTLFNVVALAVVIYVGVDVFYTVVHAKLRFVDTTSATVQRKPDENVDKKPTRDHYQPILDRNLFGSTTRSAASKAAEDIDALEPTTLKLALLGTVAGTLPNAVAIIEETDKRRQGIYKVGDSVQTAVVKNILREKVVLRVDERDEILTMQDERPESKPAARRKERHSIRKREKRRMSAKSPPVRGGTITLRRADLQVMLKDINKLLSQVRIRPHFRNGQPDGLSVSNIKKGSLFTRMGLRSGDIVQKVNNRPMESADDMIDLYEKLKAGDPVSLELKRRNRSKNLNYRFK